MAQVFDKVRKKGLNFSSALEVECVDKRTAGECFDNGAQGGAFAVTAGPRSKAFAKDWVTVYVAAQVDALRPKRRLEFGAPPPPASPRKSRSEVQGHTELSPLE